MHYRSRKITKWPQKNFKKKTPKCGLIIHKRSAAQWTGAPTVFWPYDMSFKNINIFSIFNVHEGVTCERTVPAGTTLAYQGPAPKQWMWKTMTTYTGLEVWSWWSVPWTRHQSSACLCPRSPGAWTEERADGGGKKRWREEERETKWWDKLRITSNNN